VRLRLQSAGRDDVDDGPPTGLQQRDAVFDHQQTAILRSRRTMP
jgi:hypothetical protein